MPKRPVQPDIPDRCASVDDILATLGDESFEDYTQRQYDEGYARGYEVGLAMAAKFVLDRAAEIWKRADGDNDGDFRAQLEANMLRKISREIAGLVRNKAS